MNPVFFVIEVFVSWSKVRAAGGLLRFLESNAFNLMTDSSDGQVPVLAVELYFM